MPRDDLETRVRNLAELWRAELQQLEKTLVMRIAFLEQQIRELQAQISKPHD